MQFLHIAITFFIKNTTAECLKRLALLFARKAQIPLRRLCDKDLRDKNHESLRQNPRTLAGKFRWTSA